MSVTMRLAMQSLDTMQGVVQQEIKGLKAERGAFKDLMHDAKWAASQQAAADQAPVSAILHCLDGCLPANPCTVLVLH